MTHFYFRAFEGVRACETLVVHFCSGISEFDASWVCRVFSILSIFRTFSTFDFCDTLAFILMFYFWNFATLRLLVFFDWSFGGGVAPFRASPSRKSSEGRNLERENKTRLLCWPFLTKLFFLFFWCPVILCTGFFFQPVDSVHGLHKYPSFFCTECISRLKIVHAKRKFVHGLQAGA